MKIFFDLDGTLIDSKERLYQLFQHLVPDSKLTFQAYWHYKRDKIGHRQILKEQFLYSDVQIENFQKVWLSQIENFEWLSLDKPFEGLVPFLTNQKRRHDLYLVTARQFEDRLLKQIDSFHLTAFFKEILVTAQKTDKAELIKRCGRLEETDWLVSDMGKDIETGKGLGLKTAAVLSGFMNRERLLEYRPDIIVDHVTQLKFYKP